MDILKSVFGFVIKFTLALGVLTFYFWGLGEYLFSVGLIGSAGVSSGGGIYGHSELVRLFWYGAGFIGLFFAAVLGVCAAYKLAKAKSFFVKSLLWVAGTLIVSAMSLKFFAPYYFGGSKTPVLKFILLKIGFGVVLWFAYLLAGVVLGFLGTTFEMMSNGMPKGRGAFFDEALRNGYAKPQARVFVNSLMREGEASSSAWLLPSMILYAFPVLVTAMTLYSIFYM